MFANKSAEYPEGFLDRGTLKSFYAITGPDDGLTYTPGYERIPENWYKRALDDEYTTPFFFSDFKNTLQEHPELIAFGGNTGTVNSFAGLVVGNLTVSSSSYAVYKQVSSKNMLLIVYCREVYTTPRHCSRAII